MVLDTKNEDDVTAEVDGILFLLERDLSDHYEEFWIDFAEDGFARGWQVQCLL